MPPNTEYQFTTPTRSGQFSAQTDGQSVSPSFHFSSESSLGFYRSAASVIAQSYGTLVTSQISSAGTVKAPAVWASSISVGGTSGYTGSEIKAMSFVTAVVPAHVVQGSASSSTVLVWPAARAGDVILNSLLANPGVSSLSSGLVMHSHCTVNGQVEFRYSNVSTLVQNQSAQTVGFLRISAF